MKYKKKSNTLKTTVKLGSKKVKISWQLIDKNDWHRFICEIDMGKDIRTTTCTTDDLNFVDGVENSLNRVLNFCNNDRKNIILVRTGQLMGYDYEDGPVGYDLNKSWAKYIKNEIWRHGGLTQSEMSKIREHVFSYDIAELDK